MTEQALGVVDTTNQQADDTAQQTSNTGDKDFKKMYYATLGRTIKNEERMAQLEAKLQSSHQSQTTYGEYEEDQVQTIQKIAHDEARRIVESALTQRESTSTQQKEQQAFLSQTPEAYEHLEDLERLRGMFPNRSYSRLYKKFVNEEDMGGSQVTHHSMGGGTQSVPTNKIDPNNVTNEMLDAEFDQLVGRKK